MLNGVRLICFGLLLIFMLTGRVFASGNSQDSPEEGASRGSEFLFEKQSPEDAGFSPSLLLELDRTIKERYSQITSMIILRHGELVFEEYYQNTAVDSLHQIRSVTKGFTSALIGIALEKGYLASIDQKAEEFFPEYASSISDGRFGEISIEHLLEMTSGIPYNYMNYGPWIRLENQIKSAFVSSLASEPGSRFNYNDPGVHILSGILTKATNMQASEFAQKYLFSPLDITTYTWPTDNQGNNIGSAELTLTTRDIAKFGQLYLNKGEWNGQQIVPAAWVEKSTAKQTNGGGPSRENYGYLWWVTTVKGHPAYFAMGFGGQFIYVVPELELVVVITSKLDRHYEENREIVGKYIIPAINS